MIAGCFAFAHWNRRRQSLKGLKQAAIIAAVCRTNLKRINRPVGDGRDVLPTCIKEKRERACGLIWLRRHRRHRPCVLGAGCRRGGSCHSCRCRSAGPRTGACLPAAGSCQTAVRDYCNRLECIGCPCWEFCCPIIGAATGRGLGYPFDPAIDGGGPLPAPGGPINCGPPGYIIWCWPGIMPPLKCCGIIGIIGMFCGMNPCGLFE